MKLIIEGMDVSILEQERNTYGFFDGRLKIEIKTLADIQKLELLFELFNKYSYQDLYEKVTYYCN